MLKFAAKDSGSIPDNQKADFKKRKLITEVLVLFLCNGSQELDKSVLNRNFYELLGYNDDSPLG